LKIERLDAELATLDQERARPVNAIATGGELAGLLDALRTRDRRRAELDAARMAVRSQHRMQAKDTSRVRDELMTLAGAWRQVLADDPMHGRPIISGLLKGRVTYTPLSFRRWQLRGEGTLFGLFSRGVSCCDGVPNGIRYLADLLYEDVSGCVGGDFVVSLYLRMAAPSLPRRRRDSIASVIHFNR
jgi:hypothetical protein